MRRKGMITRKSKGIRIKGEGRISREARENQGMESEKK